MAIARELGIIDDASQAIDGRELNRLSDEELERVIDKYSVYARVQPEHKVRIVCLGRRRGMITAMTGDGVNDAPSIKSADIGVGMGITGTDVTKNVADMVLADDNFATIVAAVGEGRRIYDNIRKAIQFLLASNMGEVVGCSWPRSWASPTPLTRCICCGSTSSRTASRRWPWAWRRGEPDIMDRPPRKASDGFFAGHMGADCIVQGIAITLLVLASFFAGVYFDMGYINVADMIAGTADEEGVMMAFITLNMVEIFHCFNMRSRRASLFSMKKQNWWRRGGGPGPRADAHRRRVRAACHDVLRRARS